MKQSSNNDKNSKTSEIIISFSRKELQNMKFDPTKPHIYIKQKAVDSTRYKMDQYKSNNMINSTQAVQNYQIHQDQIGIMTKETIPFGMGNRQTCQYKTQQEYYENNPYNNLILKSNQCNLNKTFPFPNDQKQNWPQIQYQHQNQYQYQNTYNINACRRPNLFQQK